MHSSQHKEVVWFAQLQRQQENCSVGLPENIMSCICSGWRTSHVCKCVLILASCIEYQILIFTAQEHSHRTTGTSYIPAPSNPNFITQLLHRLGKLCISFMLFFFTVFMNVLCVCVCVQQARFAGLLAQLVWFETHRVVRVVAGKSYQLGLN